MKRLMHAMLVLGFGLLVTNVTAQNCTPAQKAACAKICAEKSAEAEVAAVVQTAGNAEEAAPKCDIKDCPAICKLICSQICGSNVAQSEDVQGAPAVMVNSTTKNKTSCAPKTEAASTCSGKKASTVADAAPKAKTLP